MGVNNDIFWSEMGSKFGKTGGTSPPRLPLSQFHQQKQITRDAAVTTTIRESKTKIAL